jgi:hypothetical protein
MDFDVGLIDGEALPTFLDRVLGLVRDRNRAPAAIYVRLGGFKRVHLANDLSGSFADFEMSDQRRSWVRALARRGP